MSDESELNALLSCPFCGSDAHITERPRGYRVECVERFDSCTVNMRTRHSPDKEKAIKQWNTRAG